MEQILLSKKNYHRASKVVNLENQEQGEFLFIWRGKKLSNNLMHCDYAHTAIRISDNEVVVIYDKDLGSWAVTDWKYDVNLEELWKCACDAFYSTSFNPEERAALYIRDYEKELNADLETFSYNERHDNRASPFPFKTK